MFCPGCKTEFNYVGDVLEALAKEENFICPECSTPINCTRLEEWLAEDLEAHTKSMKELRDRRISLEEEGIAWKQKLEDLAKIKLGLVSVEESCKEQMERFTDQFEGFHACKKRWHTDMGNWLAKEKMFSCVQMTCLLSRKRAELEEKRHTCDSDNPSSTNRDKYLYWKACRDMDAIKTNTISLYVIPNKKICTLNDKTQMFLDASTDNVESEEDLSNEAGMLLYAVWSCLSEDKEYLIRKMKCLLAAEQVNFEWFSEETTWVDMFDALTAFNQFWYEDILAWLIFDKKITERIKKKQLKFIEGVSSSACKE